jgi:diguanylate cyclase (GGDEF)-like protein
MIAWSRSSVRDTASAAKAPAKVAADDILVRLHTTREPRQRLQLLLGAAEHVSAIDARRAYDHALEAAAVATELADDVAHAEALFQQGRCAELLLDHGPALDLYGRALSGFEAAGNELATAKTLRAIGFIHDSLGDFSQALDFQLRALEIDERIGNTASRAATLNNIGINLKNLGLFQDAHAALTQAHQLFAALGMPLLQCAALNNLGLVQEKIGDTTGAERTLNDALALSGSVEYQPGVAHAHMAIGRMLVPLLRHDEAREHLLAGLDISERNGIKLTGYECHEALADLYERVGDSASALRHFRRFHQLEHEVQLESAGNKLRAFAIQYQVAAAKRDAELQRERQAVLTRANVELDALNVSLTEANLQKTMLLDQLERQTFEDALTGLANRRRLDQRLADEFALALRHNRPLAVAIADLDEFKRVNDRFSHAVGDAALRALAKLLSSQVRHTDLVARFGGEEFVLVLVQTDSAAACPVCEKLRDAVEKFAWDSVHPGLALTLSIGVCADTTLPGHERMLALADRNLYLAKEGGRNRVVC